jgi:hypothetical protein
MPAGSDTKASPGLGSAFVCSIEQELMTVVRPAEEFGPVLRDLLRELARLAPALSDPSGGVFNAYGRVYLDMQCHLELAALECDDPYQLALLVETQQDLLACAARRVSPSAGRLLLANNNHSGPLQPRTATWGTHENYLVARHPSTFAAEILPFLVTRIYGGAGGVRYPSGERLAGARPLFMALDTGGDTTTQRAIHSTAREEHHAGPNPQRFRYHLIAGDGHRSQKNLALQVGATALVLRALESEADFAARVHALTTRLGLPHDGQWLHTLAACNRLADGDAPLRVHPLVLDVQSFYLDAARAWAARADAPPPWVARCLCDWQDTLDALARHDEDWLAARLDAFAKLRLLGAALSAQGLGWTQVRGVRRALAALTLLEHGYHDLVDAQSVFCQLDAKGLLAHRVGDKIVAGREPEPFVPAVATRAQARARFLVAHRDRQGLIVDWAQVVDRVNARAAALLDPFAREFAPWRSIAVPAQAR